MRDKIKKIQRLRQELIKYCNQIGILEDEIPTLVFSNSEWNNKRVKSGPLPKRDRRTWGRCSFHDRLILVRIEDIKYNRKIKDLIHTLIHELVHYKWNYLPHGKKFEERIEEIRKGRTFLFKSVKMTCDKDIKQEE